MMHPSSAYMLRMGESGGLYTIDSALNSYWLLLPFCLRVTMMPLGYSARSNSVKALVISKEEKTFPTCMLRTTAKLMIGFSVKST